MYCVQQSRKYVKDVHKVAHLQVVVVFVKAVWGIFNNTNGLYLEVDTLLVIYKSRYYSINDKTKKKTFFLSNRFQL